VNRPILYVLLLAVVFHGPVLHAQLFSSKKDPGHLTEQPFNARKHFRTAKTFMKQNQHYAAACHILDAIDVKPRGKYFKKLGPISEKAYRQKLALAASFFDKDNYERALEHYQHLEAYLDQLAGHNLLNFATIDVGDAVRMASVGVAEEAYEAAERSFGDRDWQAAIDGYRRALEYAEDYKDSRDKIAASHYRSAGDHLSAHRYRAAVDDYLDAHRVIKGYMDARTRAAEIYFRIGRHHADQGHHRAAWTAFDKVVGLIPDYRTAAQNRRDALEKATTVIGFGVFQNRTNHNVGGIAVGDFIFSELRAKLSARKSKFVEISNDLSQARIVAEGQVTQVHAQTSQPTEQRKHEPIQWTESYKVGDETKYVTRKETIHYLEKTRKREVVFAGTVTLTDKKTSEAIFGEQISQRATDRARWAELLSDTTNTDRFPTHLSRLMAASNQLRGEDEMIKEVINAITDSLTDKILALIDHVPEPEEPSRLELVFER